MSRLKTRARRLTLIPSSPAICLPPRLGSLASMVTVALTARCLEGRRGTEVNCWRAITVISLFPAVAGSVTGWSRAPQMRSGQAHMATRHPRVDENLRMSGKGAQRGANFIISTWRRRIESAGRRIGASAQRRGAVRSVLMPRRSHQSSKAARGTPRKRRSSSDSVRGTVSTSVASRRYSGASPRWAARVAPSSSARRGRTVQARGRRGCLPGAGTPQSAAVLFSPKPSNPGMPSAVSPVSARKSGILVGANPRTARKVASSVSFLCRRSTCTTWSPRRH